MLDTEGRVAMISGANRGLGLALARRLHRDGYHLALGARDVAALAEATADLGEDRVSLHLYDAEAAETQIMWVSETIERWGGIDALVNNAGVLLPFTIEAFQEDLLDIMWTVNVKAPARMTHLCLPHLIASGTGRVVNVASMSGKRVRGGLLPGYAMTKHAVMALTHATRQSGWDDGIRALAVCPGLVATDMTVQFGVDPATMIQPEDLVETVASIMALPNTASISELHVMCELDPVW